MINAETAEIRAEIAEKDGDSLNAISGQIVDAAMRVSDQYCDTSNRFVIPSEARDLQLAAH